MLSVFPSLILPRSGRFPFCFWACLGELRFSSSFVAYIAHFLFTCLVFACSFVGCAKKASVSHPRSSEWQPRSLLSPSWFWFSTQSFAPKISSPLCFPLMFFLLRVPGLSPPFGPVAARCHQVCSLLLDLASTLGAHTPSAGLHVVAFHL
jgi:hypothetical protein